MRLSLAIEGFLLYRAGVGSMATVRDYRNTLHKWVACIGDVDTSELNGDTVRRFLYHLRIEEELAPKNGEERMDWPVVVLYLARRRNGH